jgi:hypothetical protein
VIGLLFVHTTWADVDARHQELELEQEMFVDTIWADVDAQQRPRQQLEL